MKQHLQKKKKKVTVKQEVIWYAFMDIASGYVYPTDVAPICSTLWEARQEKKKFKDYYSNTKIVKITSINFLPH